MIRRSLPGISRHAFGVGVAYAITLGRTVRSWHDIRDSAGANESLAFLVGLTFISAFWSLDRAATFHISVWARLAIAVPAMTGL